MTVTLTGCGICLVDLGEMRLLFFDSEYNKFIIAGCISSSIVKYIIKLRCDPICINAPHTNTDISDSFVIPCLVYYILDYTRLGETGLDNIDSPAPYISFPF